jgi:FKBP-type peptidyl-prolyl cis-trans isomerase SlyD
MHRLVVILFLSVIFCASWTVQAKGEEMTIQQGKLVSFDYTLTVDNQVIDTSKGKEPLQYTHGEGKIIPGLSKQLEGMKVGDEKRIVVGPEEAYGPVNPSAFQEVPKSKLPSDLKPEAGMHLQVNDQTGKSSIVMITEVKEDSVVLNLNHPLAGKTLTFDVKVVAIK